MAAAAALAAATEAISGAAGESEDRRTSAANICRYYLEPPATSDALLIVFSGHFPDAVDKGYEAPFEFRRFLGRHALGVHALFVRDPSMAWYLAGVEGVGASVQEVADFLREEQGALGAARLFTLGSSMGGYAALLFGHLLQADVVLAFGPQIYLDQAKRREVGIRPYGYEPRLAEVERMCRGREEERYLRITNLLPLAIGQAHIHLGQNEPSDINQAMGLNDNPNVKFVVWPGGNHMVVKALRDEGKLLPILRRHFAPPAGTAPQAPAGSPAAGEERAEALRSQGNELVKAGQYAEAIAVYNEALQAGPSEGAHPLLLANRSLCLLRLGQAEEAWYDADAAFRLNPRYAKALYRRAQCEAARGMVASARRSVAEALALEPKDAALLALQADLQRRTDAGPAPDAPFAKYCE